jgi:hypothetical protein
LCISFSSTRDNRLSRNKNSVYLNLFPVNGFDIICRLDTNYWSRNQEGNIMLLKRLADFFLRNTENNAATNQKTSRPASLNSISEDQSYKSLLNRRKAMLRIKHLVQEIATSMQTDQTKMNDYFSDNNIKPNETQKIQQVTISTDLEVKQNKQASDPAELPVIKPHSDIAAKIKQSRIRRSRKMLNLETRTRE